MVARRSRRGGARQGQGQGQGREDGDNDNDVPPLSPYVERTAVPSPTSTDENVSDEDDEGGEHEPLSPEKFHTRQREGSGGNGRVLAIVAFAIISVVIAMSVKGGVMMTTTARTTPTSSASTSKGNRATETKKQLPPGFLKNTDTSAAFLTKVTQTQKPPVNVSTGGLVSSDVVSPCFVLLSAKNEAFEVAANTYNFVFGEYINPQLSGSSFWDNREPAPSDPAAVQMMLHSINNVCKAKKRCNIGMGQFYVGAETERNGLIVYNVDLATGGWREVIVGGAGGGWMQTMEDIVSM